MASTRKYNGALPAIAMMVVACMIAGPRGALGADPDPLQDFCVADLHSSAPYVGCYPCKPTEQVTAEDFAFSGLAEASDLTGNPLNATAALGFVRQWPALNTLGLSLARLDINPGGVIIPHTHNLATEILFCLEGEIFTGFVTNSDHPTEPSKLYAKTVRKGEAFIFPRGLLHFQINKGTVPAVSLNVLNSQNPGIQLMPIALFGSAIDAEVLAKSFFISEKQAGDTKRILSQFVNIFDRQ